MRTKKNYGYGFLGDEDDIKSFLGDGDEVLVEFNGDADNFEVGLGDGLGLCLSIVVFTLLKK
jgi:hypothetical protein